MKINEAVIKRCSCGSLLKKRSCGGRVIKSHTSIQSDDLVFRGPSKVLKLKK